MNTMSFGQFMLALGALVFTGFGAIIVLSVIAAGTQGKKLNMFAGAGQLFKPGTYTSIGLDFVLVILAIGFLSWFWMQSYQQSWAVFRSHDSFWATIIGMTVAIIGLKNFKHYGGRLFCCFVITLSVINIVTAIPSTKKVVEEVRVIEDYVPVGVNSREYKPLDLVSVTFVKDCKWKLRYIDPQTKEEQIGEWTPCSLIEIVPPSNAKGVWFISDTEVIKIKVRQ